MTQGAEGHWGLGSLGGHYTRHRLPGSRCIQPAVLAVAIAAAGLASSPAVAQESNGTPAARAAFDEGARRGRLVSCFRKR